MASGTSGRRRTTTRKKTAASSRKTAAKRKEENAFIRDEIKILLLFALSVLLLLSAFGVGGAAGDAVSGVLFGLFGLFAYVLPIGLFFVAAFSISNKANTIAAVQGGAMIAAGFLDSDALAAAAAGLPLTVALAGAVYWLAARS